MPPLKASLVAGTPKIAASWTWFGRFALYRTLAARIWVCWYKWTGNGSSVSSGVFCGAHSLTTSTPPFMFVSHKCAGNFTSSTLQIHLHITVCISSYVICIHFTDLYHFCPVFYWPGHVGPAMEGVVCSNNMLTPLPVYMQVQTRSSFPHFPAHEPLPLLPIKRVHRGATRPLLGGKLGLTVWTGHSAPGFILFLTPRWNLTWKHRNYLK